MIKPIAIYLPQFHPIPENNKAWGEGFTEWTNVRKAKPLFEGHFQPHEPHEDVGYYDLRDTEVMVRQAAMAKEFGIYGFAFYHYWFNGKRLLETPLDNMLKTGTPDFPFLYIWANENWTKRWDGLNNEVIIKQEHSIEDDKNHIQFLCKNVFSDKRYITIDEKPVFMVYRTELLPNINETARIWREEAQKFGFKDLYLVRVEGFRNDINPLEIGFDASMEFAPDWKSVDYSKSIVETKDNNTVIDYVTIVQNMSATNHKEFPWFRCVTPGWDNSARKSKNATIFKNNTPEEFENFLFRAIQFTKKNNDKNKQFVFINAWNEWAEGCHIEPDKIQGYSYLEAVKRVLDNDVSLYMEHYIEYLENTLHRLKKQKNECQFELDNIKIPYQRYQNSIPHKFVEKIMTTYRKIKRLLK